MYYFFFQQTFNIKVVQTRYWRVVIPSKTLDAPMLDLESIEIRRANRDPDKTHSHTHTLQYSAHITAADILLPVPPAATPCVLVLFTPAARFLWWPCSPYNRVTDVFYRWVLEKRKIKLNCNDTKSPQTKQRQVADLITRVWRGY